MGFFRVLILVLFFSSESLFADCDINVIKTINPIELKTKSVPEKLCLNDYFAIHEMGFYSFGVNHRGRVYSYRNYETIQFHDFVVFESQKLSSMGPQSRLDMVKTIYDHFLTSLKNENGRCELTLKEDDRVLNINDFQFFEREMEAQPGSRLMLTLNTPKTFWKLTCPNGKGQQESVKQGNYIYIFMEVYENLNSDPKLKGKGHLMQFLFSLN